MRLEQIVGLRKLRGLHAHVLFPEEVEILWDLLEPYYQRSIAHSQATMSLEVLKASLIKGESHAIVSMNGDEILAVFAGRVVEYTGYNAYRITAAAGRKMKDALAQLDVLISWALSKDCVELESWCRPAIQRLLRPAGFRFKFAIVTLDIRRKLQ